MGNVIYSERDFTRQSNEWKKLVEQTKIIKQRIEFEKFYDEYILKNSSFEVTPAE